MGAANSFACFETVEQAAADACSRLGGVSSAGVVSCPSVAATTESGAVLNVLFTGAETSAATTVALAFRECTPFTAQDGESLGWMFGTVVIAIAAMRMIASAARGQ